MGTAATALALSQVWLHPLLKKVLPAPGQGPSRDAMLNGHYKHAIVGYTQVRRGFPVGRSSFAGSGLSLGERHVVVWACAAVSLREPCSGSGAGAH